MTEGIPLQLAKQRRKVRRSGSALFTNGSRRAARPGATGDARKVLQRWVDGRKHSHWRLRAREKRRPACAGESWTNRDATVARQTWCWNLRPEVWFRAFVTLCDFFLGYSVTSHRSRDDTGSLAAGVSDTIHDFSHHRGCSRQRPFRYWSNKYVLYPGTRVPAAVSWFSHSTRIYVTPFLFWIVVNCF